MKKLSMVFLASALVFGNVLGADESNDTTSKKEATTEEVSTEQTRGIAGSKAVISRETNTESLRLVEVKSKNPDDMWFNSIATGGLLADLGKYKCLNHHKEMLLALSFACFSYAFGEPHTLLSRFKAAQAAGLWSEKSLDLVTSSCLTVAIASILSKVGLQTYKHHLKKA